jgi:hydrogenase expression/formation protein HypE
MLKRTGAFSPRLVTLPKAGLDFAAVQVDGSYLIVSADPITGVDKEIGEYAMKVSANDVATSGNPPQFAESVVLLPEGTTPARLEEMAKQMDSAAKDVGVSIVGGHTEVTPGLTHPIVIVTEFSVVKDYVSSADAQVGDSILMTKSAGLEGTAILAGKEGDETARKKFLGMLSVVVEAVGAYKTGYIHAMHDCTEGGVLGATFEMSLASGLGFRLTRSAVPIAQETRMICDRLSLDPLCLIGSGALLLSVERGKEEDVKDALKSECSVAIVGEFTKEGRELLLDNGKRRLIPRAPEDELWRLFGRTG